MSSINSLYVDKNVQKEMKNFFLKEGFLRVDNFLEKDVSYSLLKKLEHSKTRLISEPDSKQLGLVSLTSPYLLEVGSFLQRNFLIKPKRLQIQKFSHRSYTLLKKPDSQVTSSRAFLFFSPQWDSSWGGTLNIMSQKNPLLIIPQQNTLFLVKGNHSTHFFIKYVSHFARKNSFFVASW